jgi:hypothetical protein
MTVGMPLQSRETSREPQAIIESLGRSRMLNILETFGFSDMPVNYGLDIEARTAVSRKVRPNSRQFQDL